MANKRRKGRKRRLKKQHRYKNRKRVDVVKLIITLSPNESPFVKRMEEQFKLRKAARKHDYDVLL